MNQPATQHPHGHRRFHSLGQRIQQRLGLPLMEAIWGALFFVGISAALALAIWSSLADGQPLK